ncbi:MAG: DUF3421 domain-containing protein [Bacteroidales bacterium]|jgi:hypothetical protein|nr:DUF3421 domain-containing protein [Bacteroidales bacterium]
MRRFKFIVAVLGLAMIYTSVYGQTWVNCKPGTVPSEAKVCGNEKNGAKLYLVRTKFNKSFTPGKYGKHLRSAHFAYGNREKSNAQFQIYIGNGKWVASANGRVPLGAVVCGYDTDQKPLYAARAKYNGGIHIGKMKWGFKGAHISYGGREIEVKEYEILTEGTKWKSTTSGRLPVGCVVSGNDTEGNPAFVARAKMQRGVCPGYSNVKQGCFPFNGRNTAVNNFEVFVGKPKWRKPKGRKIPLNAIVTGFENNGHPMFTAKVKSGNNVLIGKMRDNFGNAHFIVSGRERELANYKILVF